MPWVGKRVAERERGGAGSSTLRERKRLRERGKRRAKTGSEPSRRAGWQKHWEGEVLTWFVCQASRPAGRAMPVVWVCMCVWVQFIKNSFPGLPWGILLSLWPAPVTVLLPNCHTDFSSHGQMRWHFSPYCQWQAGLHTAPTHPSASC